MMERCCKDSDWIKCCTSMEVDGIKTEGRDAQESPGGMMLKGIWKGLDCAQRKHRTGTGK